GAGCVAVRDRRRRAVDPQGARRGADRCGVRDRDVLAVGRGSGARDARAARALRGWARDVAERDRGRSLGTRAGYDGVARGAPAWTRVGDVLRTGRAGIAQAR